MTYSINQTFIQVSRHDPVVFFPLLSVLNDRFAGIILAMLIPDQNTFVKCVGLTPLFSWENKSPGV